MKTLVHLKQYAKTVTCPTVLRASLLVVISII